jgi:menaquinol-cytochrome c reductase iron-sulfur subunit
MNRRRLLTAALYAMWGLIALMLSAPAMLYLLWKPRRPTEAAWAAAGALDQIRPGRPVELSFERSRTDGWQVLSERKMAWVVKLPDQRIVAFGPQCTHLGCAYHWDENKSHFICPCHMSAFGVDGSVLSGPASRPLERYETRVRNNLIEIGALRQS